MARLLLIVFALIATLLAALGIVALNTRDGEGRPFTRLQEQSQLDVDREEYAVTRQTVEDFLAASTIEERLAMVRHPDETEPRMRAYYAQHGIDCHEIETFAPRLSKDSAFGLNLVWLNCPRRIRLRQSVPKHRHTATKEIHRRQDRPPGPSLWNFPLDPEQAVPQHCLRCRWQGIPARANSSRYQSEQFPAERLL